MRKALSRQINHLFKHVFSTNLPITGYESEQLRVKITTTKTFFGDWLGLFVFAFQVLDSDAFGLEEKLSRSNRVNPDSSSAALSTSSATGRTPSSSETNL